MDAVLDILLLSFIKCNLLIRRCIAFIFKILHSPKTIARTFPALWPDNWKNSSETSGFLRWEAN